MAPTNAAGAWQGHSRVSHPCLQHRAHRVRREDTSLSRRGGFRLVIVPRVSRSSEPAGGGTANVHEKVGTRTVEPLSRSPEMTADAPPSTQPNERRDACTQSGRPERPICCTGA